MEKMRFVPVEEVPFRGYTKTSFFIEMVKKIPKGKSWLITEDDKLGLNPLSIRATIKRYQKKGVLPDNYRVSTMSVNGITQVYVSNAIEVK